MITLKLIVSVRLNVMPVFLLIFISLYSSIKVDGGFEVVNNLISGLLHYT
jgi:hypothetical protein